MAGSCPGSKSSRRESNPRPIAYKASALTAELREEIEMPQPMEPSPIMVSSFALEDVAQENSPGGRGKR